MITESRRGSRGVTEGGGKAKRAEKREEAEKERRGTGGETREGKRVRDEDEKSERGIEKDGTGVEVRRRDGDGERGMGGGEMENERPLVQRARPTGSTLLSSLLLSSSLLSSPLLASPRLASPHLSRAVVS